MKTIVITGGTFGIGYATVRSFLSQGHKVVMLARSQDKADKMKTLPGGANLYFVPTDLTDMRSVRSSAAIVKEKFADVEVLINNAGGIITKREVTVDGFEKTFALNHIGHFLLTHHLLPELVANKSRVINVSSAAHKIGKLNFDDLQWAKRSYSSFGVYGDVKLCNIYFTEELHNRYHKEGLSAFALHPGVVRTQFGLNATGLLNVMVRMAQPFMISPEKGAETSIYLAITDHVEKYSGKYFVKKKVEDPSLIARDYVNAKRLWDISEELVKDFIA